MRQTWGNGRSAPAATASASSATADKGTDGGSETVTPGDPVSSDPFGGASPKRERKRSRGKWSTKQRAEKGGRGGGTWEIE